MRAKKRLNRNVAGFTITSFFSDAMLSESVPVEARGKAFGLHRAGDTVGAIVGPLMGVRLLAILPAPNATAPFRAIFLLSLIPGLASVAAFALLVREKRRPANHALRFWGAVRELPRFLRGVGFFGTAYGVMGTVNGVADLVASALVGTLWTQVSGAAAFACARLLMLPGAALLIWNHRRAAGASGYA